MNATDIKQLMKEGWRTIYMGRDLDTAGCIQAHSWSFFRTGETKDGNCVVLWRRKCQRCGKEQIHLPDDVEWKGV